MGLDGRGIVAIVEIVLWSPVLIFGILFTFRHGFTRHGGWNVFTVLALIRLIAAITHIVSEKNPDSEDARKIYIVIESAGLAPLIWATLGLLRVIYSYSLDSLAIAFCYEVFSMASTIGMILSIYGGTDTIRATRKGRFNTGTNSRHGGAILYVISWVGSALLVLYLWMKKNVIPKYRRRLLTIITVTLPFVAVRAIYAVLSAYAPFPAAFENGDLSLAKFGTTSSSWGIYLGMAVLMEYIPIVIYIITPFTVPLVKDLEQPADDMTSASSGDGNVEDTTGFQQHAKLKDDNVSLTNLRDNMSNSRDGNVENVVYV